MDISSLEEHPWVSFLNTGRQPSIVILARGLGDFHIKVIGVLVRFFESDP